MPTLAHTDPHTQANGSGLPQFLHSRGNTFCVSVVEGQCDEGVLEEVGEVVPKLGAGGQHSTGVHGHKGSGQAGLVVGHSLLVAQGGDVKVLYEGWTNLHRVGQ